VLLKATRSDWGLGDVWRMTLENLQKLETCVEDPHLHNAMAKPIPWTNFAEK